MTPEKVQEVINEEYTKAERTFGFVPVRDAICKSIAIRISSIARDEALEDAAIVADNVCIAIGNATVGGKVLKALRTLRAKPEKITEQEKAPT